MEFNTGLRYVLNWPTVHRCGVENSNFWREGPEKRDLGWDVKKHDLGDEAEKRDRAYKFLERSSQFWDGA